MKKLFLILLIFIACEKETPIFPEYGQYGINILGVQSEFTHGEQSFFSDRPIKIVFEIYSGQIAIPFDFEKYGWINTDSLTYECEYADCPVMLWDEPGSAKIKFYSGKLIKTKQIFWY